MAMEQALPIPAAIFIGTVNAVGGGLLCDVLVREEPLLFKPSQFYALVSAAGSSGFEGPKWMKLPISSSRI